MPSHPAWPSKRRAAAIAVSAAASGVLTSWAIAVAQMQLERLKSLGFGNIAAENGTTGNVTWVAQVANVSFGLDRITVTASWQNKGVVETLTVSDLISMR